MPRHLTGTNSIQGIGRAAAAQFALNGARAIYLADYETSNLEAQKAELGRTCPDVGIHILQLDAADERAVSGLVDECLGRYGRLDVFFANAGVSRGVAGIGDADAEGFMAVMRTNALRCVNANSSTRLTSISVFLAAKHGSRGMRVTAQAAGKTSPGGSIVATASVAGVRSNAGATDYSASKAAVISIMQTACYQLAGTNIRCNAICPGIIETGMTRIMYEAARQRGTEGKIGQLNPLRRGGVADEIARVALLFLASDESSYVNGQAWMVDGGLSAGHPFVPGKLA